MTESALAPLTLAVPLLAAAVLAGTQSLSKRLLGEAVALTAAAATTVICGLEAALAVRHCEVISWFGGWQPPRHGVALGISFAIDPFGAGLACFGGVLTIAALVFSWRHFESVGHAFPALMLVFMTAIMGFCESGDLFNMFVFFELMTVSGIALTAHRSDQRAPLQGALNFGITNAIGGFLVLFGIALLYGRTGALNLAQIGVALHGHPVDGLVAVAFGLLVAGFFVKAAIVPFHFWLADAYASAPTPVCVIFAGVMSELGLYGVARVYWTVFAGPLHPHTATVRLVLVLAGALTAVGGAVMCLLQDLGKTLIESAVKDHPGYDWVPVVITAVEALIGAAAIAAAARAFLGWGPDLHHDVERSPPEGDEEGEEEISGSPNRTPAVLFGPAVVLLTGSVAIGIVPGVGRLALAGAQRFEATSAYAAAVLHVTSPPFRRSRPRPLPLFRTCSPASASPSSRSSSGCWCSCRAACRSRCRQSCACGDRSRAACTLCTRGIPGTTLRG